jgi:hypothetical protein
MYLCMYVRSACRSLWYTVASSGHGIVDPAVAVCGSCYELRTCGVEAHVQDLIVVAPQSVHAGAAAHIPHLHNYVRLGQLSS